jgi:hypothetical protein
VSLNPARREGKLFGDSVGMEGIVDGKVERGGENRLPLWEGLVRGLVLRQYLLLRKSRYERPLAGISGGKVVLDVLRDVAGMESVSGPRTWEGMSSVDISRVVEHVAVIKLAEPKIQYLFH